MVVVVQTEHQDLIEELLGDVAAYKPDLDRDLLTRAFLHSARAHAGQQRRSGEEFIRHPWSVAKICAELRLDEETVDDVAAYKPDLDRDLLTRAFLHSARA